ncbi:alpha-lytic protease prodomain-containing protein [Streptomyces phaeoluteigriseus]|uniref:alpha-lytic protease prodomain-containing protein n=1 Tax=Streptomyces phaeoluteigriseus TaxID=114686 RepID=UPI003683EAE4
MVARPAAGRRRAALTAVSTLVLTAVPAVAAAGPPHAARPAPAARTIGAEPAPPEVLRALQRDLRLTAGQAAARLANEAEAGPRAGRLHNALGARFAGAWVTGRTSAGLTVATTDAADVPAIRAEGAQAAVVTTPLSGLLALKNDLDEAAGRVRTAQTPVWYVDVRANRVVVQATSRSAAKAFIEAAGAQAKGVGIRVSAERPRPTKDIVGGDAYYIDAVARCSVGFSVTKAEQQGFATAGHCGRAGSTTTGFDDTDQGVFQASVFPGKDMAWVGVNSDWTATAAVRAEAGTTIQVSGSVQALVGASVCRSGSTSGWHCGTVEQHDASVSYPDGPVDGLTRTTVCGELGDSGGSFVAGTQAQGVTSGGSGDCTSGGTTYFQPVNTLLEEFGLTLTTAGATGTPAPQQGTSTDSWAPGRVYEVGETVSFSGVDYQCLQNHQAQSTGSPEAASSLWQRA